MIVLIGRTDSSSERYYSFQVSIEETNSLYTLYKDAATNSMFRILNSKVRAQNLLDDGMVFELLEAGFTGTVCAKPEKKERKAKTNSRTAVCHGWDIPSIESTTPKV